MSEKAPVVLPRGPLSPVFKAHVSCDVFSVRHYRRRACAVEYRFSEAAFPRQMVGLSIVFGN
jgi:hypothetical protein